MSGLPEEPLALAMARVGETLAVIADSAIERSVFALGRGRSCVRPRRAGDVVRFASELGGSVVVASIERAAANDTLTFYRCGREGVPNSTRSLATPAPIASLRRGAARDRVLVAYTGDRGPVMLATVIETGEGLSVSAQELDAADGRQREVLALDVTLDAFVALFRRGVPEDQASAVVLAIESAAAEIEVLHDVGIVERLERTASGARVVASFEFERPREFLFDPRLELVSSRPLPSAPVAGRRDDTERAEVDVDATTIVVRIRNEHGDVVSTDSIARTSGSTLPVVSRDVSGFAVAFTERSANGWAIRVVRLSR